MTKKALDNFINIFKIYFFLLTLFFTSKVYGNKSFAAK